MLAKSVTYIFNMNQWLLVVKLLLSCIRGNSTPTSFADDQTDILISDNVDDVFTAKSYPAVDHLDFQTKCGVAYTGMDYICDPDALLSKTEAERIDDRFVGTARPFVSFQERCKSERDSKYGKQAEADRHRLQDDDDDEGNSREPHRTKRSESTVAASGLLLANGLVPQHSIAIALARGVSVPSLCNAQKLRFNVGKQVVQEHGNHFASNVRKRWTLTGCDVDLLIFCATELTCSSASLDRKHNSEASYSSFQNYNQHDYRRYNLPRKRKSVRHPKLFISMNERHFEGKIADLPKFQSAVQKIAISDLTFRSAAASSGGLTANGEHCSDKILRFLQLLNESMAASGLDQQVSEIVPEANSTKPWMLRTSITKQVPNWAIIVFCTCFIVSVGCTLLGNFVNKSGNLLYCASRDADNPSFLPGKSSRPHHRKWRAGFGGGLFERMPPREQRVKVFTPISINTPKTNKLAGSSGTQGYLFRGFSQRKANPQGFGGAGSCRQQSSSAKRFM